MQRFIDDRVNASVTSGLVSTKGNVRVDMPPGKPLQAAFAGDVTVAEFAAVDKASRQDLLNWKSLFIGGIDFQLEPLKVSASEVALSDFYSRLIVNPDGTLNLQRVVVKPGEEATSTTSSTGAAAKPDAAPDRMAPPTAQASGAPATASATVPGGDASGGLPANVRVGRITLQGGNVNFSDFFIKPNYTANLTGIGGVITEMTPDKAGDVELRGKVDNTAPVEILGRLNPLSKDLFLDIKASARDIELPPLSPYAIKYAGYGIQKGKLSVNVKYFIENRKLSAENNVYLDQLTFGDKVESPTATKLPVLLAVSLLKDRNGVIDIDLPISGSLDDPEFSVGGIIVRVIVNLLTKVITAPFAALASAFGGKEELSYVEYAPGGAALDADSKKRLDTLGKALNDRPSLRLEVAGRVDPQQDREGLKRAYVDGRVKAEKAKRLGAGRQDAGEPGRGEGFHRGVSRAAESGLRRGEVSQAAQRDRPHARPAGAGDGEPDDHQRRGDRRGPAATRQPPSAGRQGLSRRVGAGSRRAGVPGGARDGRRRAEGQGPPDAGGLLVEVGLR